MRVKVRELEKLTRVTQKEVKLDVSRIVYWRAE